MAEFINATPARKLRIIKEQKFPSKFIVSRYRIARNNMVSSIRNQFSETDIISGLERLNGIKPKSDFQTNDVKNSIEALRAFLKLQFPNDFKTIKCEFSKPEAKGFILEGVNIIVSPDIILRGNKNGKPFVGGIKFHISKSKKINEATGKYVAHGIKLFLKKTELKSDEIILPEYCLCVDVFGERVIQSPKKDDEFTIGLSEACEEIKRLWPTA
ncbi:MAG TPA: hypothetical protein DCM02_09465 [Flavobacterium sp.]|nr:hypothetical protein [Flavobacterium sp.]